MSLKRAFHAGAAALFVLAAGACTGLTSTSTIPGPATEASASPTSTMPVRGATAGTAATTAIEKSATDVIVALTPPTPGLGAPIGTVAPGQSLPELTPAPTPPIEQAFAVNPPESDSAVGGTWYEYHTDHCGVYSPIDFDGSFWIAVAVSEDPDYDIGNSRPGRIARVDDDTAMLLLDIGVLVLLKRHDEAIWYYLCM